MIFFEWGQLSDSNPGLLGEKHERCFCAMPTPSHLGSFDSLIHQLGILLAIAVTSFHFLCYYHYCSSQILVVDVGQVLCNINIDCLRRMLLAALDTDITTITACLTTCFNA